MQVGLRHSSISRIFSGSVAMPAGVTTCPRYKTLFWNNLHFFGFNLRFACLSLRNTNLQSSQLVLKTITSSRYTSSVSHCNPDIMFSISLSKVLEALHNPKGITFHWYSPPSTTNVAFSLAVSSNSICQYPDARSSLENQCAPESDSRDSLIVASFSFR